MLSGLTNLVSLDLLDNAVTEAAGYKDKVYKMFPKLEILDGFTKDGEEYFSEEDEDYGEEGEEDMYDLDEEEIEELKRRGITQE